MRPPLDGDARWWKAARTASADGAGGEGGEECCGQRVSQEDSGHDDVAGSGREALGQSFAPPTGIAASIPDARSAESAKASATLR